LESELANLNAVYGHAESPERSLSVNLHRFLLLQDFSRSNHDLQLPAWLCSFPDRNTSNSGAPHLHRSNRSGLGNLRPVAQAFRFKVCGGYDTNGSCMFTRLLLYCRLRRALLSQSSEDDQGKLHTHSSASRILALQRRPPVFHSPTHFVRLLTVHRIPGNRRKGPTQTTSRVRESGP
jgi:hypothetical protein